MTVSVEKEEGHCKKTATSTHTEKQTPANKNGQTSKRKRKRTVKKKGKGNEEKPLQAKQTLPPKQKHDPSNIKTFMPNKIQNQAPDSYNHPSSSINQSINQSIK